MTNEFLSGVLKEKSGASILIENVQKLVQVFAIILGGLWALKEFYNFQDRTNELTLKQQRLSVEQAELAKAQSSILAEQQRLALETARVSFEGEKVKNELARRQLKVSQESKYSFNLLDSVVELKTFDDDTRLYLVTITFTLDNTSDAPLEISGCVLDDYLGDVSPDAIAPNTAAAVATPPLSVPERSLNVVGGPIKWTQSRHIAYVWGPSRYSARRVLQGNGFTTLADDEIREGGCSAAVPAGNTHRNSIAYLLRAKPDQWIGFSVIIYFGEDGTYRWKSNSRHLATEVKNTVYTSLKE